MTERKKITVVVTGEGRVSRAFLTYARSAPDAVITQITHNDCKVAVPECDYLVHIGARVFADKSVTDPLPYVQDNVNDLVDLLEIVRRRGGATRLIYLSTVEASEPKSPYAGTKAAAEALVAGWGRAYRFPFLIVRSPNLFIPDYKDKGYIGALLRCEIDGPKSPHRLRQWLDGAEFAEQLWNLMQTDQPGRTITLPGELLTDAEIALKVEAWKTGVIRV